MKAEVKKLKYYPASITAGTYISGSSKTIDDLLDTPYLIDYIENKRNVLKRFRGEIVYNATVYTTYKTGAKAGDYWFYLGKRRHSLDLKVLEPNDIVYFDGTYFCTLHTRFTNAVDIRQKYDVCIIGGGAGGVGAAYALRNSGWRVCLVERNDALGGTHAVAGVGLLIASPVCQWYKDIAADAYADGGLNFYNKSFSAQGFAKSKGVGTGTKFEKLFRASQFTDERNVINGFTGNHVYIGDLYFQQRYYNDLKDSIDLLLNYEVIETKSKDTEVSEVIVRSMIDGTIRHICADYFIDCSGDGVMFTSDPSLELDVDYYIGTDPQDRYSESIISASTVPNHYGINTVECLYYTTTRDYKSGEGQTPYETKYKKYTNQQAKGNFGYQGIDDTNVMAYSVSYGLGMTANNFIDKSVEWNMGDAYDRAMCYTRGQSRGIKKMLAIREKYRVNCEAAVSCNPDAELGSLNTQITSSNYVEQHTIALSTWYTDIHNQSYYYKSMIANGIPYEAAIPRCYKNVLCGSRCYGASHIGLSSVRLVKTMLDLGHSCGIAIKQLLDSDARGDVRTVDVAAVQDAIRIADVIDELETYFYGSSVTSEDIVL